MMPRFALHAAVAGLVTAGVSLVGAVLGVALLGLQTAYLLVAAGVAFLGTAIAYYSVSNA